MSKLKTWKKKLATRKERLGRTKAEHRRVHKYDKTLEKSIARQRRQADHARKRIEELKAGKSPRLITAAEIGLEFTYPWGGKGTVYRGSGHYTATDRAANATELVAKVKQFHAYHKSLGWGGLSYEALVADDGTICLGNPIDRMSAAVAAQNTGMVNVCIPGTTGDRMSAAQKASVRWLFDNWHTDKVPVRHRLPRSARALTWKGHNQWPGQSTACPGVMQADYDAIW